MKLTHILIPGDLSEESLRPLEPVAQLARDSRARVTLLHMVEELMAVPHGAPLAPPVAPLGAEKRVEEARARLEEQRKTLGDDLEVSIEVVTGDNVAEAVAHFAQKHAVDLIALSTHGRTGFKRFALGSVAEAILRHSPVPVLAFPQPKES
jgi:nucleotide-binding universal stress UspA family protein